MADDNATTSVSVVICAYTERRWSVLVEAVESVQNQEVLPAEVVLVIDHNDALLRRAADRFPLAQVVANGGARGLSGARNTGVECASGDIVAFLDDDARAQPGWLSSMVAAFSDERVIGAGGVAAPRWESPMPAWLPPEFLWVVGCSYTGLPDAAAEIRNPIGANMAFRRDVLERAGGFTDGIGRVGRVPLGCEETELSIRARVLTGGIVMYVPGSRVEHLVTTDRMAPRYFLRRCWAEGLSKALVGSSVGTDAALSSERTYATRTLPLGVARGLVAFVHGDRAAVLRSAAIIFGLVVTTAGYGAGRLVGACRARGRR